MTSSLSCDVSGFDNLHPAIQFHVVNTLGWNRLRTLQDEAIDPILAGHHTLLLAPTAGGKTEAAVFPALTRVAREEWAPVSVLYLAPLRALLNNLLPRLEHYVSFTGHRVGLWHGDVGQGARARLITDPPDILLTTPESLEAMLISRRVNEERHFQNLQMVVVDEVHSFAAADRGWHMLAVLERLTRLAGRELQRVGLSATVGDPEALIRWLTPTGTKSRIVLNPSGNETARPEVTLDYVGNLPNAATVISRLHRGEKRLVFVDSRRRVEELAQELRARSVTTFVSHGSLGRDERVRAEQAFAEAADCVIVSTSTLELGIDVGDLDRVIQIDAPSSVASFLQRIGRAGRRTGSIRNALFLTTSEEALVQAAGLLRLWESGYVEPATSPPFPLHLLAQQLLAITLQEGERGLERHGWEAWLGTPPSLGDDVIDYANSLVEHLLAHDWLFQDGGRLSIGERSDKRYGRRNFLDLMSAFVADPMYRVMHGRTEIGQVPDEALIAAFQDRNTAPTLLLAGRSWLVREVDWKRRKVHVEPHDRPGRIRYPGVGQPLSFELCQAMAAVLMGSDPGVEVTERASTELGRIRSEAPTLDPQRTTIERMDDGRLRWWTFAGLRGNVELAARLTALRDQVTQRSNLYIDLAGDVALEGLLETAKRDTPLGELIELAPWATATLKAADTLPEPWVHEIVARRVADPPAVEHVLSAGVRWIK